MVRSLPPSIAKRIPEMPLLRDILVTNMEYLLVRAS
jgi:hypothetical protein